MRKMKFKQATKVTKELERVIEASRIREMFLEPRY